MALYHVYKRFTKNCEKHVLVISGPSGAGKTTLIKRLQEEFPGIFRLCVSHTTRPPRPNEVDGTDYNFVDGEEMTKSIDANEFIEWTEFAGNLYGTSRKSIDDIIEQNKVVVLDLNSEGVRNMLKSGIPALYIMILPPSTTELVERLQARNTETAEAIEIRVRNTEEMFDFALRGNFNTIIINDNLDEAYRRLKNAVHPLLADYYKHEHIA